MPRFTKEAVINAPPETVFAYVSDLTKHPELGTFKMTVDRASEGPVAVGSKYRHTGKQMGQTSNDELTVTEYEPPRRFAWESTGKDGAFRHVFELTPEGSGTRVSKTFDMYRLSLPMKLFLPTIYLLAPKQQLTDLQRIKAKLEQPVASA